MGYENIILQTIQFIQVFLVGIVVLIPFLILWYIKKYNYIVELNIKSGSGLIIKNMRAKKVKQGNLTLLRGLMAKKDYKFPDDTNCVYKKGMGFLVRYYVPDETNYAPMKFGESDMLHVLHENLLHVHTEQAYRISEKYARQKDFMAQYGAVIGIGFVAMSLVLIAYFFFDKIEGALALGRTVIAQTAACSQGQVISAVPA